MVIQEVWLRGGNQNSAFALEQHLLSMQVVRILLPEMGEK